MASIIKSDNGVSSGITGIVQSADSSGQLVLQTTTSGGTATTAVTIDNTQKVTFANSIGFGSNAGITFNNSSALTNSTLNDYETGTWTVTDQSGAGLTFTSSTGQYTKIGNMVYFSFDLNFPSTANTANVLLSLPFTGFTTGGPSPGGGAQTYNPTGTYTWFVGNAQSAIKVYTATGTSVTNITFSSKEIAVTGVYKVNF